LFCATPPARAGEKELLINRAGTEQFFTVEISPADKPPAAEVQRHELSDAACGR
jgi:hypothetical protein